MNKSTEMKEDLSNKMQACLTEWIKEKEEETKLKIDVNISINININTTDIPAPTIIPEIPAKILTEPTEPTKMILKRNIPVNEIFNVKLNKSIILVSNMFVHLYKTDNRTYAQHFLEIMDVYLTNRITLTNDLLIINTIKDKLKEILNTSNFTYKLSFEPHNDLNNKYKIYIYVELNDQTYNFLKTNYIIPFDENNQINFTVFNELNKYNYAIIKEHILNFNLNYFIVNTIPTNNKQYAMKLLNNYRLNPTSNEWFKNNYLIYKYNSYKNNSQTFDEWVINYYDKILNDY